MGISNSVLEETKAIGLQEFQPQHWNKISSLLKRSPSISVLHNHKSFESELIYQSLDRSLKIEEYTVDFSSQYSFLNYIQGLEWRNKCQQFVQARYVSSKHSQKLCSQFRRISVYFEHIPIRLTQINDIPFPENLYVLRQALLGFKTIFRQFREIKITEELICINAQCQLKVWVNPLLSESLPDFNAGSSIITQAKIIEEIVNMIARNTDHTYEPVDIKEYINSKHANTSFDLALRCIQEYALFLQIKIPNNLKSCQILFDSFDLFSSQTSSSKREQSSYNYQPAIKHEFMSINQKQAVPTLELIKHKPSTHYTNSQASQQSTQLRTPKKQYLTERHNLQQFHPPSDSLPRYPTLQHHHSSKQSHSLDVSQVALVFKRQTHNENYQSNYCQHEQVKALYGQSDTVKIIQNTTFPKKWTYFNGCKDSLIDSQIAADLNLLSRQGAVF